MGLKKTKLVIVILIVILVFLSLNKWGADQLRNTVYLISAPFQKCFYKAGKGAAVSLGALFEVGNLKRENYLLKNQNVKLLQNIIKLQEVAKENAELREVLRLKLPEKFSLSLIKVLSKPSEEDTILINKGKKDGVGPGMPVITSGKVLVGKTGKVLENFSEVTLISNPKMTFDIEISQADGNPEKILGLAKGKGNLKLSFQFVPKKFQVRPGDIIVTSRLGGNFPQGLLVGQISTVEEGKVEPYLEGKIKPYFIQSSFETLFLIKNFVSPKF